MAFRFLSDEWLTAAKAIRTEYHDRVPPPPVEMKANLVITEVPDDGEVEAHIDTTGGEMQMDVGHLAEPHLSVRLDFETAKAILLGGNPQAGMQAFMAGKIKIEGDMTKMMAMQSAPVDPIAEEVAKRIRDITL